MESAVNETFSAARWHFVRAERQWGPVTFDELLEMLREGSITINTLVWRASMTRWLPLREVPEMAMAPAVEGPVPVLQYSGPPDPREDWVELPTVAYAGFGSRFVAFLIDQFLVMSGAAAIALPLSELTHVRGDVVGALGFGLGWIYYAAMESACGGTLGKLAVGIRVTDIYQRRIGFGRASGRFLAKILSQWILFIGFLMVLWTQRKQGLHDIIAGCLVIRKEWARN